MTTTEQEVKRSDSQEPAILQLELAKKEQKLVANESKLKDYLNTFYGDIHAIRLRIQMHLEIANASKSGRLLHDQFWGFFQGNANVNLVVAGMFSIFDDNTKYILKQFTGLLRTINVYSLTNEDISRWLTEIAPYESFRHCIIAHTTLYRPSVPEIDYEIFLKILEQFEHKLVAIQKKHITHPLVIKGVWNASTIDLETPALCELRKLLSINYLP
jgi:hypothetical protein